MPAPPPKTNPWKKPVVDQPVPEKSSKPSSDAKTVDVTVVTEKLKPEKTTKVKPSTGESKQQQTVSKSNPWKKLEKSSKAVDEEVGGGETGEDERRGEKGSSTWPTLAIKPSKKKKEGEEVSSVEEGKENQVGPLPFLHIFHLLFPLFRTSQISTTTTISRVTTTT